MIKVFILSIFPSHIDEANSCYNKAYCQDSDRGHEPSLLENIVHVGKSWKLRSNNRVLEGKHCGVRPRWNLQAYKITERSHSSSEILLCKIFSQRFNFSPVKCGNSDTVDDTRGYVVQHERGGGRLQREVGDQGVVGEDLHLVASQVSVELCQGRSGPHDHGTGGVEKL